MTNSLGTKIRELRMIAGLSQEELGRRVGVQRAAINKYEVGSVTNIPIATIEKLASVFDVSPTYLVGWNDELMSTLSAEVKTVQAVQHFYGKDAVEGLELYANLSEDGKQRALQYIRDMSVIYKT